MKRFLEDQSLLSFEETPTRNPEEPGQFLPSNPFEECTPPCAPLFEGGLGGDLIPPARMRQNVYVKVSQGI